ncbi:MAG: hypothetical protein AAGI51_01570 [Pseudomonadota bacterium]
MTAPASPLRLLAGAIVFLAAGLIALFVQVAPISQIPADWRPDLVWCVLAFFALRAPRAAPLLLVALLLLARDALTGAPPGAGALALLLAFEGLRLWAGARPARPPLLSEAIAATGFHAGALALQWLLLAAVFAPTPDLDALARHLAATALALPLVAALLRGGLGLGRPDRGAEAPA